MPNKQPTFRDRCQMLHDAAEALRDVTVVVANEAHFMAEAEKRFAARDRKPRNTKASR